MAMLITRFNRLIRSRILWGIFAVVISVAFVGLYTEGGGCEAQQNIVAAGMLNGAPVPMEEFRQARLSTMVNLALAMGRPINALQGLREDRLREQAWKRLMTLRETRRLGLVASNQEILDAIRQNPDFAADGAFSKDRYRAFIRYFLPDLRDPLAFFEEYLREEASIQKLLSLLSSAVWIPPAERAAELHRQTDLFTVELLRVDASNLVQAVSVDTNAARAYFEEHAEAFAIPPMVSVAYVTFPLAAFTNLPPPSEEELDDYYNEHLDDYTTTGTNGQTLRLTLDEVREEIRAALQEQKAFDEAENRAWDYINDVTPDRQGRALSIAEAAARYQVRAATTEYFSANDPVDGVQAGFQFNRRAFELLDDSLDEAGHGYVASDPVRGEQAVYVLALNGHRDERIPAFEEVADEALRFARSDAEREAFRQAADTLRASLAAALETGATFAAAAAAEGLNLATTVTFSAYDAPEDLPNGRVLLSGVLDLRAGELSEFMPLYESGLLAYVSDRRPGEAVAAETMNEQVVWNLTRRRTGFVYEQWVQQQLADAGFEDKLDVPIPADEDEDEDSPEEAEAPLPE